MMKRLKWMIASLICLPINTLAQGYTEATNYWIDKYQSVSYPLKSIHISSPYGIRADPFTGEKRNHQGIDLVATYEEIYAMFDGFIKTVGYDPIAGYYITLQVGNYTLSYCHLSEIWVKEQETVNAGDTLGKTGTSGRATGPHLHLTCRLQGKIENPYLLLTFVRDTQQKAVEALGLHKNEKLRPDEFLKRYAPLAMSQQRIWYSIFGYLSPDGL